MHALEPVVAAPHAIAVPDRGALIEFRAADVACQLSTHGASRGAGPMYELSLVNAANAAVACRIYGVDRRRREHTIGELVVLRQSGGRWRFAMPNDARFRHVYLRVTGEGIDFKSEAQVPRKRPAWTRSAVASMSAGVFFAGLALVLTAASLFHRPALPAASIAIAATPQPALRPPPAAQPRVGYFTARRETDGTATSVLASYLASGDRGLLRVLGAKGNVLGSAPFSHVGTTRIPLNGAAASEPIHVEIEVERDRARAGAALELAAAAAPAQAATATPSATPSAAPSPDAAPIAQSDDGATDANARPADPFAVTARVVAGHRFEITIRHSLLQMSIALQDAVGTTLDQVDVPQGATSVALFAPNSVSVETYYLAATYGEASRQETLIRSLRVFPH